MSTFQKGQHVRISETIYDCPTAKNTYGAIHPGDIVLIAKDYDSATAEQGQAVLVSRLDGTGCYLAWPRELTPLEAPVADIPQNHPFLLDLLAGWTHYIGGEEYGEEYHGIVYALYQKAGLETVGWNDEPESRDLTLGEQITWLRDQLGELGEKLGALQGPVYVPAPVEDQDDDTPFPDGPQDCEVILTDKVIHSALVFVEGATSRKDAAEKARDLAGDAAVEWRSTYESEGDVDVASVKVGEERGR